MEILICIPRVSNLFFTLASWTNGSDVTKMRVDDIPTLAFALRAFDHIFRDRKSLFSRRRQ
jgi:hypothetical protein